MENITIIYNKLSSVFNLKTGLDTHDTNNISSENDPNDPNDPTVIDLQKTFSSENIDITPIIKKILQLHIEFPQNILHSKDGHKYNELEFFKSNLDSNVDSNTQSLFDKFNRTQTQLGKTLLQSIILEPTINIDELIKHRQNMAITFMKNKQLKEICSRLEKCKVLERDILSMQLDDTPEMLEVYKVIFFEFLPLKKLNYSETFLKLFYYFVIIFSPIYGIIAPFVFMFAPFVFMRYVLKIPISFDMFWTTLKTMILGGTGFFSKVHNILNSNIGKAAETMIGGGDSMFSIKNVIITLVKWIVAFMNSALGTYVYFGFIIITYLYGVYNTAQVSITYNKIINMFHSRLNIIAKWLQTAVGFYKMGLGFESPEIAPVIGQIKQLLETNTTIANLLQHTTFNDEPGIFSNKGIIIKTFKEFLDMKETLLEPFCKYMAHIDVWSSIGKWLSEGYGVNRNLCSFVMGSDKPLVEGFDVWNICCDVPVYNDVKLGMSKENEKENEKDILIEKFNNLLITGPNGSGKSTYIKSIIECILLGQTVGVVPAKEFSFTPFTNIATYLNIPDCQGKESLFQAEMNRCYQQIQMLKGAEEKGEFSFNIMDEIFVSTNYQEGMSGAYAIIKRMCNMNKCLNIITTHFDVLAGMEEVKVAKKYFDIEIDEVDNIKRDYKIKDGVSKKHMALKLLKKKGFDASIIEDAEYLYEKLQGGRSTVVVGDSVVDNSIVGDSVVDNSVVDNSVVDNSIVGDSSLDTKDILEDNKIINSSLDTKDILEDNKIINSSLDTKENIEDNKIINSSLDTKENIEDNKIINSSLDTKDIIEDNIEDNIENNNETK